MHCRGLARIRYILYHAAAAAAPPLPDRLEEELEVAQEKLSSVPKETEKMVPMEGLDVLYLKNVVIKFLEASTKGEATSTALLPVIATLLQFTPEEFKQTQESVLNSIATGT
eukprot:6189202-Pyramimonas_sp.AAC.1